MAQLLEIMELQITFVVRAVTRLVMQNGLMVLENGTGPEMGNLMIPVTMKTVRISQEVMVLGTIFPVHDHFMG